MNAEVARLQALIGRQMQSGQVVLAEKNCRQLLELTPEDPQAWFILGSIADHHGRLSEATECYEKAVAYAPGNPELRFRLGNMLWVRGELEASLAAFEKALELAPGTPEIEFRIAITLNGMGRHDEALEVYRGIEARAPEFPGLHNNIGLVLMKLGRCDEAIDSYHRELAAEPDNYMAHNNLGNALQVQQRLEEAIESFRHSLKLKPDHANAHSNLLLAMNYVDMPQADIYAEACRFGNRHTPQTVPTPGDFDNDATPDRRLRIGFVSPDLRSHSVTSFFLPILEQMDRSRFEVTCYSSTVQTDATTERVAALADRWCPITGWADDDLARRVREDGIDILVDLAGHTALSSVSAFARKLAPVQVNWLGYPNTTGVPAIDYRLTDAIADPVGIDDELHSEKLVRLEHGFLCYTADAAIPDVAPTPCLKNGFVTFGSFNALAKIRPSVARTWATILAAVPDSRLILKASGLSDSATRQRLIDMFADAGVDSGRIECLGWMPSRAEHMAAYAKVDIGLETFPYNGTTTTCEALWMGVPVVTLRGSRHAGRVGASILHRIGLDELIAESERDLVDLAVALAGDSERLSVLRSGLRDRMLASPLTDTAAITRGIEDAFRDMWRTWCAERAGA